MIIRKQKAESGEVEVDSIDAKQGIVRSFTHLHSGDRIALAPIPGGHLRCMGRIYRGLA
jgi:hypothetical protein